MSQLRARTKKEEFTEAWHEVSNLVVDIGEYVSETGRVGVWRLLCKELTRWDPTAHSG